MNRSVSQGDHSPLTPDSCCKPRIDAHSMVGPRYAALDSSSRRVIWRSGCEPDCEGRSAEPASQKAVSEVDTRGAAESGEMHRDMG